MLGVRQILMASQKSISHRQSDLQFLTVRLHALSVPRPLPPEGNYRLCLSLVVQRLHAACCIGAVKEEEEAGAESEIEHNCFNVITLPE